MEPEKIEYTVRPVTRYRVSRYHQEGRGAGSESKGEFDSREVAHEVATALCRAEHQALGWPLDDERIQYPSLLADPDAPAARVVATVGEMIAALSEMDPTLTVMALEPPFDGVKLVPQNSGGVLFAAPRRRAKSLNVATSA